MCHVFSCPLYLHICPLCFLKIYPSSFFLFGYTGSSLQPVGSVVGVCGLVSSWHVGCYLPKQELNPTGRRILNHWTTREVPKIYPFLILQTDLSFQGQSRVNLLDYHSLGWLSFVCLIITPYIHLYHSPYYTTLKYAFTISLVYQM